MFLDYFRFRRNLIAQVQHAIAQARTYQIASMEANRSYLALKEQVRLLNRAVQRRNRTVARLRARIAADAPTNLPELARSKDGRALYNHAYNKGRIRGRRDVLDAMVRGEQSHEVVRAVAGADMEPITVASPTPDPAAVLADHPQATMQ